MKPSSFPMRARAWRNPGAAGSTSPRRCRWPPTRSSTPSTEPASTRTMSRIAISAIAPTARRNIGRQAALLAGLPKSTAGVSVNRFCSSGLQTIAMAANSIRSDGADCIVAGGVESISIPGGGTPKESIDPELLKIAPDIFMAMIDTADIVAERYKVSREYQDEYLAGIAAPHGRRPAGQQVQGRDRPDEDQDEGGQQGDQGREHRRLRRRQGRVQPSRHHDGRPGQARAGEGPGQVHHRRQRQPAVRRRRRRGADGSQGSREARPQAARPLRGLGGRRLRAGRDGHRPDLRRAETVEAPRPEDRRHRPVGAERGLRQPVPLFAATSSASIRRSTTSTAARSRSAIPSA